MDLLTIREAVAKAAGYFRGKGIATARLDAELLVGEAVGMDRLRVYLNMDRPLDDAERDRARELVRRRGAREPVAYILGRKEFRCREFEVNPSVLVPRPETELLVEAVEAELAARFPAAEGAFRILEFGAGSGVISVSLAADLPRTTIVATEQSAAAADVARRNAARHVVGHQLEVRIQSDFSGIAGGFHALAANPPYVARSQAGRLEPEITRFEPEEAVFADEEGYAALRLVLRGAADLLCPGGFALLEIGEGMAPRTALIGTELGYRAVRTIRDYAGIERLALFDRPAPGE